MPLNPSRFSKVLGSSFVRDYAEHVVLTIGKDQWTRADLAKLGIVQLRACSILGGIAKRLGVRSLSGFYNATSLHSLADYPAGVTSLYVLFALFLDRNLEPEAWCATGTKSGLVAFATLKERERKAKARETLERKTRERKSRRTSHEADVAKILNARP